MAKTGLIVLTQPISHLKSFIPKLIEEAAVVVSDTLYICIQPSNGVVNGHLLKPFVQPVLNNQEVYNFTTDLYTSGSKICHNLDIRVLLSHICAHPATYINKPYLLKNEVSILLSDSEKLKDLWKIQRLSIVDALKASFTNVYKDIDFHFINMDQTHSSVQTDQEVVVTFPNVVIGGTFDRLHAGHKLLLNESSLRAENKLTVGITDGKMNAKKCLWELMEPYQLREKNVVDFVNEVKPSIVMEPARILDPFGPTITDPDLQAIVVSEETIGGGNMVNEERKKRGFSVLDVVAIGLVGDTCRSADEEEKVSSSSLRKRLLGTLIKPLQIPANLVHATIPYRVAVTGGIASGKSNVCKELEKLGAKLINCDLLGHQAYVKGTEAFNDIVQVFGEGIVGEDGEVDRKKLGPIVFGDKTKLEKLNGIVWPAIRKLAEKEIEKCKEDGVTIVILEAAVLFEAGWQDMVHEVWTSFVPRNEAVKRIMERNKLSQADSEQRVESQISNEDRINQSNVVFCSLWEYEYTRKQVEKAWKLLDSRIPPYVASSL